MHDIYVRDIIRICKGKLLSGNVDLKLGDFCNDTRKIKSGDVYIGIKGEVFDGNQFYLDAIEKGASVCILDNIEDNYEYGDATVVLVDDTVKCIQELASYKREMYDIPVIAITGSVGKTSTKDMIASVVEQKYRTCKTIGNYNNHIGVPLTILSLKDEEALVVEMGMNHLGEISVLSKIAKPTISVITNVGTAHIGNLGSRENILKAKLEILDGMIGRDVVINYDNDMLCSAYSSLKDKYNVSTVSIKNDSKYKAVNIEEDVFSSEFDILDINNDIKVNVGGEAFIYNSLAAYAVGNILGIDEELIKKGIVEFKLSSGRLERKVNKKGVTIIDDTYNANFDSMKGSIELLGKVKDKRKILILGDMLELGEYSKDLHTKLGDVVVSADVDKLITIGSESINIENRVIELGMSRDDCYHFDKEYECYELVLSMLDSNDVVLLKGSHSIHLDRVVNKIME